MKRILVLLLMAFYSFGCFAQFITKSPKTKNPTIQTSSQTTKSKHTKAERTFDKSLYRSFILGLASVDLTPHFSGGLMGGMTYQHVGWYLRAHTDFNAIGNHSIMASTNNSTTTHKTENGMTALDYPYTGVYEQSEFSTTVGLVIKTTSFMDLYVGVGYGQRLVNWQAREYDSYDYRYHYWIRHTNLSTQNVAYDLGLLFHIKHFSLSTGVNVLGGYKDINFELGIGGNF